MQRVAPGCRAGPLRLDLADELQPDLMLPQPRADHYRPGHPAAADVLLLIEVANSSRAVDQGPKLTLSVRHAVPEVGIVDPSTKRSEACPEPRGGADALRKPVTEGDRGDAGAGARGRAGVRGGMTSGGSRTVPGPAPAQLVQVDRSSTLASSMRMPKPGRSDKWNCPPFGKGGSASK